MRLKLNSRQCSPGYYRLIIALVTLHSLHPWFLWTSSVLSNLLTILWFCISLFFLQNNGIKSSNFNRDLLTGISILFLELYLIRGTGILGTVKTIIIGLNYIILLIATSDCQKISLWNNFQKIFAYLLLPSIVAWIFYLGGLRWPSYYTTYGQYDFNNYIFFIERTNILNLFNISRFSSYFLEPGHLGVCLSLIIYINNFNFKNKTNIIFLLADLLTLSLAGYILLFIGLAFKLLDGKRKQILLYLIILIALSFGSYFIVQKINNGNNIVNNMIFSRLEINDQGNMSGDNRISKNFEPVYKQVISSNKRYFGIGPQEYLKIISNGNYGGNAGVKEFLVINGLFGVLLSFVIYILYSCKSRYSARNSMFFTILYFLSFYSLAYPTWDIFLIILICGLPYFLELKSQ